MHPMNATDTMLAESFNPREGREMHWICVMKNRKLVNGFNPREGREMH